MTPLIRALSRSLLATACLVGISLAPAQQRDALPTGGLPAMLMQQAGIEMVHVPFKGSGDATVACAFPTLGLRDASPAAFRILRGFDIELAYRLLATSTSYQAELLGLC